MNLADVNGSSSFVSLHPRHWSILENHWSTLEKAVMMMALASEVSSGVNDFSSVILDPRRWSTLEVEETQNRGLDHVV